MIDWVDWKCKQWGRAKRHILNGTTSGPKSIFGKIKEGWSIAAAEGQERPDPQEVMLGDALQAAIAVRLASEAGSLSEHHHDLLFCHYVINCKPAIKRKQFGLSKSAYYDHLSAAHTAIKPWFPPESP